LGFTFASLLFYNDPMEITAQTPIAYLSAEFGLEAKLPIYAGGLGILAGDILKGAADQKMHMVGIGLLYRGEEARQIITPEGNQIEANADFEQRRPRRLKEFPGRGKPRPHQG
jgi:starch phosphorylase